MKVRFGKNRVSISFQISLHGNDDVNTFNNINSICEKYNAQSNIYRNKQAWFKDSKGNDIPQVGSFGGSVTFHDHSCNSKEDYKVLFNYIRPLYNVVEYEKEVEKTHRADGTPYKIVQIEIVPCDSEGR